MIRIHNRSYDALPTELLSCHCKRGTLTWNERRRAWLCTGTGCHHGLALAGVFDVDDLEFQLAHGADVTTLPLTAYALLLIAHGKLTLPWVTMLTAKNRLLNLEMAEEATREEMGTESREELQRLMREMPRRSR